MGSQKQDLPTTKLGYTPIAVKTTKCGVCNRTHTKGIGMRCIRCQMKFCGECRTTFQDDLDNHHMCEESGINRSLLFGPVSKTTLPTTSSSPTNGKAPAPNPVVPSNTTNLKSIPKITDPKRSAKRRRADSDDNGSAMLVMSPPSTDTAKRTKLVDFDDLPGYAGDEIPSSTKPLWKNIVESEPHSFKTPIKAVPTRSPKGHSSDSIMTEPKPRPSSEELFPGLAGPSPAESANRSIVIDESVVGGEIKVTIDHEPRAASDSAPATSTPERTIISDILIDESMVGARIRVTIEHGPRS